MTYMNELCTCLDGQSLGWLLFRNSLGTSNEINVWIQQQKTGRDVVDLKPEDILDDKRQ